MVKNRSNENSDKDTRAPSNLMADMRDKEAVTVVSYQRRYGDAWSHTHTGVEMHGEGGGEREY